MKNGPWCQLPLILLTEGILQDLHLCMALHVTGGGTGIAYELQVNKLELKCNDYAMLGSFAYDHYVVPDNDSSKFPD